MGRLVTCLLATLTLFDCDKAKSAPKAAEKDYLQNVDRLGEAYSLYDQGLNDYLIGNYGYAVEHLNQAALLYFSIWGTTIPQENLFFHDLALAQEKAGHYEMALESYKRCLKANDRFFDGYLNLGQLSARMGKFDDAKLAIDKCLQLNSDDPRANLLYGLILEKQGNLDEAQKYKRKAEELVTSYGLTMPKTDKLNAPQKPTEDSGIVNVDLELP